jgi:hypothetical protein
MGAVTKNGSETIETALASIRQKLVDQGERFDPASTAPSESSNTLVGTASPVISTLFPGSKKATTAGSARPKQERKLALFCKSTPAESGASVSNPERSIDLFPQHDVHAEPAIDVPRNMPNLSDHHVLQMSEKAAWAEMKRVMRGAQNKNACRGLVCFGPALPDHLVINGAPPLGSYEPVQATLAEGPLDAPNLRQRQLLYSDTEPLSRLDGASSMDDATSELLRPLLRQWLEVNMSRMLQKALQDNR